MKISFSKKLISGALSAMMAAAAVPASIASYAADKDNNIVSKTYQAAPVNGNYFSSAFENGTDGWEGRGAAMVSRDTANYADGKASLFVSGRTDFWNGASIDLDPSSFTAGKTYSFGAAVMQKTELSTTIKITLQYTDADGKTQYDEVAREEVSSGKWTALSNSAYTIPAGATEMLLYIEAPDSLTDFYIDSAIGAEKGKTVSVSGGTVSQSGTPVVTAAPSSSSVQGTGLKNLFAPWFKFGTCVSPNELNSGASFLKKNYNSITPENELKPDALIDKSACQKKGNNVNTQISLSKAAKTLKFCEENGISLRGHTFVWHSQTPDWFFRENFSDNGAYVSKSVMDKRLESFIKNTFDAIRQQYPKLDIYSYDVCNELFKVNGGGMRVSKASDSKNGSLWAQIYGDDSFVIKAFQYARKYAPKGCKLYLNDFNEYVGDKTNDIYNMAMKLKKQGLIDGIGMQSHLGTGYPDAKTYEKALNKFLSTGLEVQITELDITCTDFNAQAKLYESIFKLAMAHASQIPALTIWGTTDNVSWRKDQKPLLFSEGYKTKPAYDKVVALAQSAAPVQQTTQQQPVTQKTTTSTTTTTTTTTRTTIKTTFTAEQSSVITTVTEYNPAQSPSSKETLWGDANCDGKVDLSDAVIIMQVLSNPNKYSMTDQGRANGDVNLTGNGITNADALAIQKYKIGILSSLPESYSDKQQQTNAPATTTQVPASSNKKVLISADFSSGTNGFGERGGTSLSLDNSTFYSAPSSLAVSGRTDYWHGAAIDLGSEFVPGNSYSFSAAVLQTNSSADTVKMTLQYKNASGTTKYDEIAAVKADPKTWTDLTNTSFTIPSGASEMVLYFEMPDSYSDFFVDDVTIAENGNASKIRTGSGSVGNITAKTAFSSEAPKADKPDASKPMIAISFDDGAVGSSPTASSMRIINAIADQGFHATFFYVGSITDQKKNKGSYEEIKYAYSKGMEIANHTWTHSESFPDMSTAQIRDEVDKTAKLLDSIIGAPSSKLLRLPYLKYSNNIQKALPDYGLVSCDIDTVDWNKATKEQIVDKIKSRIEDGSADGAVVLCHETYDTTAAAIEELAPYIKAKGWQIATISEMYAAKGNSIPTGQVIKRVY